MLKTLYRLAAPALALSLVACGGSTLDDPPDGALRFINAAPSLAAVEFLLVQRPQGAAIYTGGTDSFILDEDTYTINVDTLDSNSETASVRLLSEPRSVTAEEELLLVLYDDGPAPALTQYSLPLNSLNDTDTELALLHAAVGAVAVDLYVEADGADLAAATPRATLAFKELSPVFSVPAGEYRLTATTPGDPTDILFQSAPFTTSPTTSVLGGVFASAGTGRAPLRASLFDRVSASAVSLNDASAPAGLRFINGTSTVGAVDVVVDGDFAAPLHGAVAEREIRDYVDIGTAEVQIQVTPAGNPGVIEADFTTTLLGGNFHTQVIVGGPGEVTSRIYSEDNRGVAPRVRVRFRHLAASFPLLNIVITEPGGDPLDLDDVVSRGVGLQPAGAEFSPALVGGDYEFTLIENDDDGETEDTNVIAGPIPVTWPNGQVFDVHIFESATAGQVDIEVINVTSP